MTQQDRTYFARRAAEEMERAKAATDPGVAKSHRDLWKSYLERASVGDRVMERPDVIG
ncbi:hypothetical protein [Sphingomicrobium clamense]|uniref:Uncharacterized protein n=1 Tax=Sphingomicrobium clamense TaxID=2851013 RepID=A0ABS6V6S4_9SPHN|nr:hypothetical protein [Sphingomicrobium sp. B8]MBW0145270.1 hypothetical protein [Sphingomicrobium sp. B8]